MQWKEYLAKTILRHFSSAEFIDLIISFLNLGNENNKFREDYYEFENALKSKISSKVVPGGNFDLLEVINVLLSFEMSFQRLQESGRILTDN